MYNICYTCRYSYIMPVITTLFWGLYTHSVSQTHTRLTQSIAKLQLVLPKQLCCILYHTIMEVFFSRRRWVASGNVVKRATNLLASYAQSWSSGFGHLECSYDPPQKLYCNCSIRFTYDRAGGTFSGGFCFMFKNQSYASLTVWKQ